MKIEIISGSPRKDSLTNRVALYLQNWLATNTGHEIGLIDMREWHFTDMQSVIVSPGHAPTEYKILAERMFSADAFILVSPEYNGSFSPAMKNMLDHFPKQHRKPFGIVTASPGALGGIRAALQMQSLVSALFGISSPYLLTVPAVEKKFDKDGNLLEESFKANVHNFVTEYLWLAENLTENKILAKAI